MQVLFALLTTADGVQSVVAATTVAVGLRDVMTLRHVACVIPRPLDTGKTKMQTNFFKINILVHNLDL